METINALIDMFTVKEVTPLHAYIGKTCTHKNPDCKMLEGQLIVDAVGKNYKDDLILRVKNLDWIKPHETTIFEDHGYGKLIPITIIRGYPLEEQFSHPVKFEDLIFN